MFWHFYTSTLLHFYTSTPTLLCITPQHSMHIPTYCPSHHPLSVAHPYPLFAASPLSKCTSACCVWRARLVRVGRKGGAPCLLLPPALRSALLLLLEHTSNSVMGAPQWRCCVRSTCGSTMAPFHAHLSRTRWARLQPRVHLTTLDLALLPSMLH